MSTIIQLRGDTSANWTSANPILAERELAYETDTNLYKIGDGITEWNDLQYKPLRQIDNADVINFSSQEVPAAPPNNTLNLFARPLAGRMFLRAQGPSGLSTPFQPSFFQNNIVIINTNASSTITSIGNTIVSTGTISHPAPTLGYGFMANFAANTSNSTRGTGNATLMWVRSTDINDAGGFFFNTRLAFPDSNYDNTGGTTGTRIFVGLTDQTMAVSVGSDDPDGTRVGFHRLHTSTGTTDTNWHITSKDTTESRIDTGLVFTPECVYDFYIFCPPDGSFVGWRIDNVTLGTSESGEITSELPSEGVYMRSGFQLQSVNAVTRNIRMQRVYTESDR